MAIAFCDPDGIIGMVFTSTCPEGMILLARGTPSLLRTAIQGAGPQIEHETGSILVPGVNEAADRASAEAAAKAFAEKIVSRLPAKVPA